MSELKAFIVYTSSKGVLGLWKSYSVRIEGLEVYIKSEADKVIAELKDKALQYKVLDKEHCRDLNTQERFFALQIAHHKYKRCLTMAMWCEATALWCYQAANTLPAGFHATLYGKPVMIEPARLFKRHELLTEWSDRWRELAEKFKEAK